MAEKAHRGKRPRAATRQTRREAALGVAFVSPQLVGFLVFFVFPLVAVWWYALHDWDIVDGTFDFVGLGNFASMSSDPVLPKVVVASLLFACLYVPLNLFLGLAAATAVNKAVYARGLIRTLYFLPVVVSAVAWSIVWRVLLQDNGLINATLNGIGVDGANWLREPWTAIVTVVVVQALKDVGFSMVLFLAALQGVPAELQEAALVDGATPRQVFRNVTFPLITPFVFLVSILSIISTIKSFALIYLLTGGGPGAATTTLPFYIYQTGFKDFNMGYASALAVVLFIVVTALTVGHFLLRKRWVVYE